MLERVRVFLGIEDIELMQLLNAVLFVLALTVLEMARSALGPDAGTVAADEPFLLKPRAGGVPGTA